MGTKPLFITWKIHSTTAKTVIATTRCATRETPGSGRVSTRGPSTSTRMRPTHVALSTWLAGGAAAGIVGIANRLVTSARTTRAPADLH